MSEEKMSEMMDALEEAIFSGATTITYSGKTVTYRSLDEMTRVARYLAKRLGRSGAKPRVATITYKNRPYYYYA